MNATRAGTTALALTIVTVLCLDGGLLAFCLFLGGVKDGMLYFLVGGGPPTLLYSGVLYGWLNRRLLD